MSDISGRNIREISPLNNIAVPLKLMTCTLNLSKKKLISFRIPTDNFDLPDFVCHNVWRFCYFFYLCYPLLYGILHFFHELPV